MAEFIPTEICHVWFCIETYIAAGYYPRPVAPPVADGAL